MTTIHKLWGKHIPTLWFISVCNAQCAYKQCANILLCKSFYLTNTGKNTAKCYFLFCHFLDQRFFRFWPCSLNSVSLYNMNCGWDVCAIMFRNNRALGQIEGAQNRKCKVWFSAQFSWTEIVNLFASVALKILRIFPSSLVFHLYWFLFLMRITNIVILREANLSSMKNQRQLLDGRGR